MFKNDVWYKLQIWLNGPCFSDYNMNPITKGRIERAPLSTCSFFFNMVSIMGNSVVLHIFRTKYKKSNYRFFVLLLASFDFGTAIVFVMKEQFRIQRVYHGGTTITCQILNYVGHSVGIGTVFMILFIAVERYKKICTPFQTQFTIAQCGRFCAIAIIISAILNIPSIFIFGKRDFIIENLNATRCDVLKKFDETVFPILYFGSLNTVCIAVVICIIVIQLNIRAVIYRKSQLKKKISLPPSIKTKPTITETSLSGKEGGDSIAYGEKSPPITIAAIPIEISSMAKPDVLKTTRTIDEARAIKIAVVFCIVTALLVISIQAMILNAAITAISRYIHSKYEILMSRDIFNVYFPDIVTLNGIVNPFVYLFVDDRYRQEVKTLCRR